MDYRRLCKELIAEARRLRAENDDLRNEIASLNEALEYAYERGERLSIQLREKQARAAEEARQQRWYEEERERQRSEALAELERARRRGDSYEEERALRKLRSMI